MNNGMDLKTLLSETDGAPAYRLAIFALLGLGMIEWLANGLVSATDAIRLFYNAENCLFVRKHLRANIADKIMSHGVQLPDLFEVLPVDEAHREFQRELATMRSLCLKLLEDRQLVA